MAVSKRAKKVVDETRIAKRVTKVLPVECKVVALPMLRVGRTMMRPGDSFGGRTINISRTGLLINSDVELDLKTVLDVTLTLENRAKTKMRITTHVARVKRNAFNLYGHWAMGLHVVRDEDNTMDFLDKYFNA